MRSNIVVSFALVLHRPSFTKQYAVVVEVQNKGIPRRLKISVSFLKGKLLGFIYWKKVKLIPPHDIQSYRANGCVSPPVLKVGTSCSCVARFTPWLFLTPWKEIPNTPLSSMLAGSQSRYALFWWSRISLIPVGNGIRYRSSHIVVTAFNMLIPVLSMETLFTHGARRQISLRDISFSNKKNYLERNSVGWHHKERK